MYWGFVCLFDCLFVCLSVCLLVVSEGHSRFLPACKKHSLPVFLICRQTEENSRNQSVWAASSVPPLWAENIIQTWNCAAHSADVCLLHNHSRCFILYDFIMDVWGMVQLSSNLLNFFAHLCDWILSVQIIFFRRSTPSNCSEDFPVDIYWFLSFCG